MKGNEELMSRVIQVLGFMGLIPFIVPLYFAIHQKALLMLSAERIFIVYSGIILSFLAGAKWTVVMQFLMQSKARRRDLLSSNDDQKAFAEPRHTSAAAMIARTFAVLTNVLAVLAWVVVLVSDNYPLFALLSLLAGYLVVLWMEIG